MPSKRKPYVREMKSDWWKRLPFYRFYMLREGTSVFAVWVSLVFFFSLLSPLGFVKFITNPFILIINIVAFLAALLHTKTWFELAPKAMNMTEKQEKTAVMALWGVTAVASVIILLIAFV